MIYHNLKLSKFKLFLKQICLWF